MHICVIRICEWAWPYIRVRALPCCQSILEVRKMIIQNKPEFSCTSRISFIDDWKTISVRGVGERSIAVEILDNCDAAISIIGFYPANKEGLVMANIAEQIKEQILAGVELDNLFIIAPEESELVEPEC